MEAARVSVRTLVESVLIGGDIMKAGSAERMLEGIRGHQALQSAYGEQAESEVPLRFDAARDGVCLTVFGRADVVWMSDGLPAAVEEIKTTRRDPTAIGEDDYPEHWAQAECYAHILCARHELERIEVRLTYSRVGAGVARISRTMSAYELERHFDELTAAYIARVNEQRRWMALRDDSIAALPFPYPEYRRGQRKMAAAAYRALDQGGRLLCEAPTGIGKTAAMLFSALKAVSKGRAGRLFYLTGRGTGRIAAQHGLSLLRQNGLRARSISLTARDKICPHPGTACMPDSCPRAKGHYDRFEAAREQALGERDDFHAEYIEELCGAHNLCPFEFGLDLSLDCDVVIGDYNYAFDPFVRLRRYFDRKSDAALLIDEAHNLPDRARSMFSARVDRRAMEKLRREVGKVSRKNNVYRTLTAVIRALKALEEEGERACEFPDTLSGALDEFAAAAREQINESVPYAAALLDGFFTAFTFSIIAGLARARDDAFTTLVEPPAVTLSCLSPGALLREVLGRVHAAVFFSATLTPLDYFRSVLGAGEDAAGLRLPSPFPPENLLVLRVPLPTTYRLRAGSAASVAASVAAMCGAVPDGNYLVFFPSYAYMYAVLPLVAEKLPKARLLVQRSGMGEEERAAFLAEFSEKPEGVMIAFAVMGGVFGEGIDLPGARLSGCAVVGVGLPQICLEREALRARADEIGGEGFAYAYVYPGLARVVQAAGRVIRTAEDRGVVLLIDERFGREEYQELLPAHWDVRRAAGPKAVAAAVGEFWEL